MTHHPDVKADQFDLNYDINIEVDPLLKHIAPQSMTPDILEVQDLQVEVERLQDWNRSAGY